MRGKESGEHGNWIDVFPLVDFKPGQAQLVQIDELQVAVFNLGGDLFAMEDVCTHDGSPLLGCGLATDVLVQGDEIMCPRHGARFCIRTGEALSPPAYEPISMFPVRILDGIVQIRGLRQK